MAQKQVWIITGASRGPGVHLAKAALASGHTVVATGRDPKRVEAAIGPHADLISLALDITKQEDAEVVAASTISTVGHIDVLINNAGNF
ncbi:SDR family NAD(P)-dependent oxidoreductase, partial [Pseudomonas syringae group genomosp. 3]